MKGGGETMLSGYKTYATGIAMILFGITGVRLQKMDFNQAAELVGAGFGLIFLRSGVKKDGVNG
jgi:hypothetical protein